MRYRNNKIKACFNMIINQINDKIDKISNLLELNGPNKRDITDKMRAQVKGDLKKNVRRKP